MHLWPNLVTAAGFERGTGVMINVMPPETAAETLRAVARAGVTRIHVTADYDASPDAVWRAVEEVDSHVEWMADAETIRFLTEQTEGVGTRFECITKIGPIRLTDLMEITEWEPGRSMGVRHTGVVTGTGRFTIAPARRRAPHPVLVGGGADVPVVARRSRSARPSAGRPCSSGSGGATCAGSRHSSNDHGDGGADHDHDDQRRPPPGRDRRRADARRPGVEHEVGAGRERVLDDEGGDRARRARGRGNG